MSTRRMTVWIIGLGLTIGPVAVAIAGPPGPRVVVEQPEHQFGAIDVGVIARHAFVFTNAGGQPLVLTQGRSTCGCCTCVCMVRLPEGPVAPGKSGEVTLEWLSKLYVGPFRQTATILTNDPDRPEVTLLVAGRFKGPVGVVPSMLRLSLVPEGQPAVAEVRVYNYLDEPLKIVGYELADPRSAQHFEVTWQRVPDEQARKDAEAQGGYLLRITVKPGMPPGAFRERIVLKTNVESVPRVELPVEGMVASDVSIEGFGWNAQAGVLSIGTVKSGRGAERTLTIIARGLHAKDVQLELVDVAPEFLEVGLGKTTYATKSAVSLTRLTIRVPPGTPSAAHLGAGERGMGRITLETNHPDLRELAIQVRFAVEE